jgi:hypothetical protein
MIQQLDNRIIRLISTTPKWRRIVGARDSVTTMTDVFAGKPPAIDHSRTRVPFRRKSLQERASESILLANVD